MTSTEHTITIDRPINVVEVGRGATEHEPPVRSAVDVRGPVAGRGSYRLEPVTGGTRLTISMETDAHAFFKVAEAVFARMVRRDMVASCEHLKDILEADGTP